LRKYLSASFGYLLSSKAVARKRVPIATPSRFFARFPLEGLALQKSPDPPHSHFFIEHYWNDPRVTISRKDSTQQGTLARECQFLDLI
jgi:hypothetical protein